MELSAGKRTVSLKSVDFAPGVPDNPGGMMDSVHTRTYMDIE
jgi:hypothetical protein